MKRDIKKRLDAIKKRRAAIPEGGVPATGVALEHWHKALRKVHGEPE